VAVELTLRILPAEDWTAAMELSARAFFDEPFVLELFGPDPIGRFAGIHELYGSATKHGDDFGVGAYAGSALVGLVRCSPVGACHACTQVVDEEPPPASVQALEWEFKRNVQRAHSTQGPHAWVSRVAVEPALRGRRIGRQVMDAAIAHLDASGAPAVLLECQDHRVAFYEACGFVDIGTFHDPAGADAHLMRAGR
jgi:ribosomal protein S18 acetylase RimI-like enzyme